MLATGPREERGARILLLCEVHKVYEKPSCLEDEWTRRCFLTNLVEGGGF